MAAGGTVSLPAVHDSGSGPVLLFLHAFPLDSSMWDHQVAALSGEFRCLRVDMWGCGSSPAPVGEASFAGYARAVLAALDEGGVESFSVVACSMGAYVFWELLRAAPERVKAVSLVGARAAADTDEGRAARAAMIERLQRDGVEAIVEEYVSRLVSAYSAAEPHITDPLRGRIRRWSVDGLVWALRSISQRPDSTPLLHEIAAPALVMAGAEDAFFPAREQRALADAIPHARFVQFEGSGHLPNLEDSVAFNEALQRFLQQASQPTAP